jgi:HK97 family phage prohead protease
MPVMNAPDLEPETMTLDAEFECKDAGGKVSTIEGYFAAYKNRDLQGDVMVNGCMAKSIAESIPAGKVPLLDNHVYDVQHMVGTAVKGSEDGTGFFAEHRVESTPGAQEVAEKVKSGAVKKASIGFIPVQESWEQDVKGEVTRTLHEVKLFENSVVLHPANEGTSIWAKGTRYRGLPLAALDTPWDEEAAIGRLRVFAQKKGGAGTHWLKYADAFLWRDPKRPEQADGFLLPVADVVAGRVTVVPRALLANAAMLLAGESKGVPVELLPLVQKTLAAYIRRSFRPGNVVAPATAPQTSTLKSETQAGPPSQAPTTEITLDVVRRKLRQATVDLTLLGG